MRIILMMCVICSLWSKANDTNAHVVKDRKHNNAVVTSAHKIPLEIYGGLDIMWRHFFLHKRGYDIYAGLIASVGALCGIRFGRTGVIGVEWHAISLGRMMRTHELMRRYSGFYKVVSIPKISFGIFVSRRDLLESKLCCVYAFKRFFCGVELCYECRYGKNLERGLWASTNVIGIFYNKQKGFEFKYGFKVVYRFRVL